MLDAAAHDFLVRFAAELLSVFLPILAAMLAGLAVKGFKLVAAKIQAEQPDVYAEISKYAVEAVNCAEMAGINQLIADKKQFAVEYVQRELDAHGFTGIDVAVIEDKIEAAVYSEINKYKEA